MSMERALNISTGAAALSALTETECTTLWSYLQLVPAGGLVIEVGSQLGRSSSLIGQASLEIGFHSIHIDPYTEHPEYAHIWLAIMLQIGSNFSLLRMTTEQAGWYLARLGKADLVFIDGNHLHEGVATDMLLVANKVRPGGVMLAHDYGHVHFPGVKEEITQFVLDGWTELGVFDSLAIWRKE